MDDVAHGALLLLIRGAVEGADPIGALNTKALLDPQALLAVTDTEPATAPAVSVILLVELLPLQPVPLTDQVYDVAPDTAGTV